VRQAPDGKITVSVNKGGGGAGVLATGRGVEGREADMELGLIDVEASKG
jgi:hypothetical protein